MQFGILRGVTMVITIDDLHKLGCNPYNILLLGGTAPPSSVHDLSDLSPNFAFAFLIRQEKKQSQLMPSKTTILASQKVAGEIE